MTRHVQPRHRPGDCLVQGFLICWGELGGDGITGVSIAVLWVKRDGFYTLNSPRWVETALELVSMS